MTSMQTVSLPLMNADHFQLPIGIETMETNKQVQSCIQNSWTIIPMATTTYMYCKEVSTRMKQTCQVVRVVVSMYHHAIYGLSPVHSTRFRGGG